MSKLLLAAFMATAVAACASPEPTDRMAQTPAAASPADARLVDEDEFRDVVVGRRLVADFSDGVAEFTIAPDNTVSGTYTPTGASAPTNVLEGTWSWRDGLWCRELQGTTSDVPFECQQVHVEDGVYWNIRPDGSEGARYRIT